MHISSCLFVLRRRI